MAKKKSKSLPKKAAIKRSLRANRKFAIKWYTPGTGPAVTDKVYISSTSLRELVANQLGPKLANSFGFYIADSEYYCTPIDDARAVIEASKIDRKTWVEQKFDCDDFAHVLKSHFAEAAYKEGERRRGHCFGIVWGSLPGPHAINWMVNADLKLRFVEPQNDNIFFPRTTDKEIYFMLG